MNLSQARNILSQSRLDPTPHREQVFMVIADSPGPLQAHEILQRLEGTGINRVTLYRILDLLVEKGLAWRHSGADRVFRYCRPVEAEQTVHCHFACKQCGMVSCVPLHDLPECVEKMRREAPGNVEGVDIRLDGECEGCRERGE